MNSRVLNQRHGIALFDRELKHARTVANLARCESFQAAHLAKALQNGLGHDLNLRPDDEPQYPFVISYLMLWLINKITPVRVAKQDEANILDSALHGESANEMVCFWLSC